MAYSFVTMNKIERQVNEKTGEITSFKVNCTELAPRNFNVNLINQTEEVLHTINLLIGQPVMLPIKEGTTPSGQPYFKLEPGQIIPVSLEYAKALQAQQAQQQEQQASVSQPSDNQTKVQTEEEKRAAMEKLKQQKQQVQLQSAG